MISPGKTFFILTVSVILVGCGRAEPPRVFKDTPEAKAKLESDHAEVVKTGKYPGTGNATQPTGKPTPRAAH